MLIIRIILLALGFHQLLFWIYYWQLKEYRWDRFIDGLRSDWQDLILKQFDISKWYRPKVTARAGLTLVAGIVAVFYFWQWWWVAAPMGSAILVILGQPAFDWQKRKIIDLARIKMAGFKGTVIGVTGSYGKSSTKEMLLAVLSKKFKVVSTPKNVNTEMGVAQTVLKWKGDEEVAIVEMGAYKLGEVKAICRLVRPKIGIITGIGDQHLSMFGSMENIKKAKYELIESLPVDGWGLVAEKDFKITEAEKIKTDKEKVEFEFEKQKFRIPVLGKRFVRNVIGVIKVAKFMGMSLTEIADALRSLNRDNFWPKLVKVRPTAAEASSCSADKLAGKQDLVVIDDSYNAGLESFLNLLEYVKVWKGWRKILVTSGMIELGERANEDYRRVGKGLKGIDEVILTNDKNFAELNKWGNVKVIKRESKIIDKIRKSILGKTLVIFKSRVPRVIIDSIINE